MAVSTDDCPPGRLPEPSDTRPEEKLPQTSADPEQKQPAAARTTAFVHQDTSASGMERALVEAGLKPSAHAHLRSHRPPQQMASPSQPERVSVAVRSRSRDLHLQPAHSIKEDNRPDSERPLQPFLLQDHPVREEKRTDWSTTSSDSDAGFQVSRLSYSGRKVEPVRPFSVSAASVSDVGEFTGLNPDVSDMTVYNEIVKTAPRTQAPNHARMSTHREPTPGSEAGKQSGVCSRPLFSELRQCQQDSGFDSPFHHQK